MKKYHQQNEPATAVLRRDNLIRSAALIRDNHVAMTGSRRGTGSWDAGVDLTTADERGGIIISPWHFLW
ncbi:MAG: hypothetical protein ACR5LD_08770 [Symbiopectobacterium sp.]